MKPIGVVLAVLWAGWALPAAAAEPGLETLFPRRAAILPAAAGGVQRLELPPEVLAACRADLADLRVVDAGGREVAYLLDAGPPPGRTLESSVRLRAELLDYRLWTTPPEPGPRRVRETLVVAAPRRASPSGAWELVFETERAEFSRTLEVGVERDGKLVPLIASATLFRLPEAGYARLRVALPPFTGERLRVVIAGEEVALQPELYFEASRTVAAARLSTVPLREVARRRVGEASIVELERPRGLRPARLRLETATAAFRRRVVVRDLGPGAGPEPLADGVLFRFDAAAGIEELELELAAASGSRLAVEIHDLDSPPLAGASFAALVPRTSLVVPLEPAAEGPGPRLLFGGGRTQRPRYDLAAFADWTRPPAAGEAAATAAAVWDPLRLPEAELGPPGANPLFDGRPALGFAMRPGAPVDVRQFSHLLPLAVEPSADGLSRLVPPLASLARARPDLADLRLVDADGAQWPYLVEADAELLLRPLAVSGPRTAEGVSRYELRPAVAPLRIDRIVLDTAAPFVDRHAELTVRRDAGRRDLSVARPRLQRRAGQSAPFEVAVGGAPVELLELRVHDGGDAPLELRASARHPAPALYFAAPAGEYALLVGNPEALRPRYELERVRDTVLALRAEPVVAGKPQANERFSAAARLGRKGGVEAVLLWGAIGLALAVLVVLTLRLARAEDPRPPPG